MGESSVLVPVTIWTDVKIVSAGTRLNLIRLPAVILPRESLVVLDLQEQLGSRNNVVQFPC